MKMLSLFSGIGGIDLAAQWAEIETVAFCEQNPFCQKVLQKHWSDVPIFDDIKNLNKVVLENAGISGIDIVAGGFPCQDVSCAGNGAGLINENGDITRSGLWYEMLRNIKEINSEWVIGENVAGLLSHNKGRTFAEIVKGLENANYEVLPIVSPASNYGASFEGKRVFVIATSKSSRYRGSACKKLRTIARKLVTQEFKRNTSWGETERCIIQSIRTQKTIPEDLRVNYGLPDWVDRIRALGNVVVPQQIYPIFKAITEIERMLMRS